MATAIINRATRIRTTKMTIIRVITITTVAMPTKGTTSKAEMDIMMNRRPSMFENTLKNRS